MALRTIEAPGIQVNEIDRSQYDEYDNSLPNSPDCFILGFADKGEDYAIRKINSVETLNNVYGYPQNEAERYFYNGCTEILNQGASLLVAKLPYDNNANGKYTYVDYKIDQNVHEILDDGAIVGKWKTVNDLKTVFIEVMNTPEISAVFGGNYEISSATLPEMRDTVLQIIDSNMFKSIKDEYENIDAYTEEKLKNMFGASKNQTDNCYYKKYVCNTDPSLTSEFQATCIEAGSIYESETTIKSVENFTCENIDDYVRTLKMAYSRPDHKLSAQSIDISELYKKYLEFINGDDGVNFEQYLDSYNGHRKIETVYLLRDALQRVVNVINENRPYVDLKLNDSEITSYCEIIPDIDDKTKQAKSGLLDIEKLDDYLTNNYSGLQNKIRIVDITRNNYESTPFNSIKSILSDENGTYSTYTNDCLGIVPVIVAPTNALYFQCMIQDANNIYYNGIENFNVTMTNNKNIVNEFTKKVIYENLYIDLKNSSGDSPTKETLSKMVADCFPQIEYADNKHYDKEHFKKIGIVVLSAFIDNANNKKLNFTVLESFVGSLDKYARTTSDNSSSFIDNIINSNSKYIRCFSQANQKCLKETSIIAIKNQTATSLGFFQLDTIKNINTQNSILTPVRRILDNMRDTRGWQIDLIIDAGLTNIGQYLEGVNAEYSSTLDLVRRPEKWWTIANIFDNFCKLTRKDCMYLLDAPRTFCIEGEQKIVRRSKPTNTIINNIVPKLKHLTGINSSYTAGYCNWFKCKDSHTGNMFWCPPSIKTAGVYCYTDEYFHAWDAPAGMNRGKLNGVYDTAFSPTNDEAGRMYTQCWNYAVNYPVDGIVVEGQRTF